MCVDSVLHGGVCKGGRGGVQARFEKRITESIPLGHESICSHAKTDASVYAICAATLDCVKSNGLSVLFTFIFLVFGMYSCVTPSHIAGLIC